MQSIKKLIGHIGRQFSVPRLVAITGKQLVLPFYHVVSNDRLPHINHLYKYVGTKAFERDLDSLLKNFKPITLQQMINAGGQASNFDKPSFHLTFDDGLRECADVIAPILFRKGIPATFFLNSGFVDNRGLFYRFRVSLILEHIHENEISTSELQAIRDLMPEGAPDLKDTEAVVGLLKTLTYEHQFVINQVADIFEIDFGTFLRKQKPYMSKTQILKLIDDGFTFGAHSIDHPLYQKLELEEQLEQTRESLHYVQEVLQVPYKVFAFPFTDDGVSTDFFNELYDKEKPLVDLTFGTAGLKTDSHTKHLQRIAMDGSELTALQSVKAAYAASAVQQMFGINRVKRK